MPLDWANIVIVPSDERWLPDDHAENNGRQIAEVFAPTGATIVSLFDADHETAKTAIDDLIRRLTDHQALPVDVAVIGLGPDGHTLSWFPGGEGLEQAIDPEGDQPLIAVQAADGGAAVATNDRISLTLPVMQAARDVILLTGGQSKIDVFEKALEVLAISPVIPVVAIDDPDDAVRLAEALLAGGVGIIEITLRTRGALAAIRAVRKAVPNIVVGCGTIRLPDHVTEAIDAGAQFFVSPGATRPLIQSFASFDVPALPGVQTVTHMMRMAENGMTHVKFFPAEAAGGVEYLKAVQPIMPDMTFCPTGGITGDNVQDYLSLPNVACVGGSWPAPADIIAKGDWADITDRAKERDLELAEWMDKLGYHEIWFGEHHSAGFEIIASPELMIAMAAARTQNIKLGTGVSSLPYHHPLILAERMIQLDHYTRGRVMFGAGPGALPSDAFMMGINPELQRDMMDEALEAMVKLLRGETVTMETGWFTLNEARCHLQPYNPDGIEVAVASQVSPTGATAAGRHGLSLLSVGATSTGGFNALGPNWEVAEKTAADHGNTVDRSNWRLVGPVHIAETREQARENVKFGVEKWLSYFQEIAALPLAPTDGTDPVDALIDSGMAVIGTPEDAIAQIDRMWEQSGGFGCFLQMANNWADFEQTKRSYELLARYVFPHFHQSNRNREESYSWAGENRPKFIKAVETSITKRIMEYANDRAQKGDTDDKYLQNMAAMAAQRAEADKEAS
ncbi:limB [Symbiodinium microadriaticum]|nr:limB [Symbiodinium microadriaticum]